MIKKIIKKIIYREKADSESYIKYLRKKGIWIGNNCIFHSCKTTVVDVTQPSLITIKNNVEITHNVTILCHDFAWSVIKQCTGEIIATNKETIIGNNVFIGCHSIILQGVHVGDNVIIGAGSVVNKDVPDNVVVAGNPAKVIMTLDEYYKKRKECYVSEAKELFKSYYKRHESIPSKEVFRDFFPLFFRGDYSSMPNCWSNILVHGGNKEKTIQALNSTRSEWRNWDAFVKEMIKELEVEQI